MDQLEKNISAFFSGFDNISAVYLFGSHARGLAKKGSDVDVAVLFSVSNVPDALSAMWIKQELSGHIGGDADLVVLNNANPVLKNQVIRYGKKILDKDHHHLSLFLIRLMTEYADLKIMRRAIEKNILRGRVYGRP